MLAKIWKIAAYPTASGIEATNEVIFGTKLIPTMSSEPMINGFLLVIFVVEINTADHEIGTAPIAEKKPPNNWLIPEITTVCFRRFVSKGTFSCANTCCTTFTVANIFASRRNVIKITMMTMFISRSEERRVGKDCGSRKGRGEEC